MASPLFVLCVNLAGHEQLKDPLPMFCAGQEYTGVETREYVDIKDRD